MKSYRQYCAVARALDTIGDRWSLLIVRELMIRGSSRYKDLLANLPGIATNVLAERLRDLEEVGVVVREAPAPPVATNLYHLTTRGEALWPVLRELGRWGAHFMVHRTADDVFLSHWLVMPLELYLTDHRPDEPPAHIAVRTGDEPVTIEVARGQISVTPGEPDRPDAAISGPPEVILALFVGTRSLADVRRAGVQIEGDPAALDRVLPKTDV